jgi:DNA uptake protein ComE-like DNA-binding protein
VDRLIANRQYYCLEDLVDKGVVKKDRLPEIGELGAVVAFIPVDLNSATRRDIIDITGCDKDAAKKLVDARPFSSLKELVEKRILDKAALDKLIANGAVLKVTETAQKRLSLNHASLEELSSLGLSQDQSARLLRARPFATWGELEDFLCVDSETWTLLRERSCLTMVPHSQSGQV